MEWPAGIVTAFKQVPFTPAAGETEESVVQYLLDESARLAVRRAGTNPANLPGAYETPFTPLGHLSATGIDGKVDSCTYDQRWSTAVDALYEHVRTEAQQIFEAFQGEAKNYPEHD